MRGTGHSAPTPTFPSKHPPDRAANQTGKGGEGCSVRTSWDKKSWVGEQQNKVTAGPGTNIRSAFSTASDTDSAASRSGGNSLHLEQVAVANTGEQSRSS